MAYKNAVLDDEELRRGFSSINPKYRSCHPGSRRGASAHRPEGQGAHRHRRGCRQSGAHVGAGDPFAAHAKMAIKQGATRAELEELRISAK